MQKSSSFILLFMFLSILSYGQEEPRQKELGVIFTNLDHFGFTYRTGKESALWRFDALSASLLDQDNKGSGQSDQTQNIDLTIRAGREYRNPLGSRVALRHGFDLGLGYAHQKSERSLNTSDLENYTLSESRQYTASANLIFGLNFLLGQSWVFGAELRPAVSYTRGTQKNQSRQTRNSMDIESERTQDISKLSTSASLSGVRFSAVYRF